MIPADTAPLGFAVLGLLLGMRHATDPDHVIAVTTILSREHRIGAVLVTDGESNLIGIFTGRDAVNRVLAAGKEGNHTKLAEVMTSNPITMSPNKTAIDALRLMWDGGFRHIPVVENRKLLGVISRGDFKADESERLEEERELWEHLR